MPLELGAHRLDHGWYVEPTVFADIEAGSVLVGEEILGPLLVVMPYTDDDAVPRANDSEFGLAGTV
jgi:acyl-CoA reductase-like NAD-dependent aldehyde dehydrogenase